MLPLKPFYMIRHGQSEANEQNLTAGGGHDTPLTKKGENQAHSLSPYLSSLDIRPYHIFASPMKRAHKTAKLINQEINLDITLVHNLHETQFGDWEGLPWDDVLPKLNNGEAPPNGEDDQMFSLRIQKTIKNILEETPDNEIPMIVAHGGLFYAMGLMYEYGMSPIQNCHLHLFEPHPEHALFPWVVWQYDIVDNQLVQSPAPFCSSMQEHRQKAS
jgi:broad specificity phosphatase PhoE